MDRLQHMGRRNIEVAFIHEVEELQRLWRGKGPLDREVINFFQGRGLAVKIEAITLGAKTYDLRVIDQIFPGEDHIIGCERLTIRPLGAFEQVHGQL